MNDETDNNLQKLVILNILAILVLIAVIAKVTFGDFCFQIVLTVASIILALWYTDLGKPRLSIQIIAAEQVSIGTSKPKQWLKLSVLNRPLKHLPFISRNTAFSCHGTVAFLDLSNNLIFDMPIRWSNNPQPIRSNFVEGKIVTLIDQSLIRASNYVDIPADESEALDVCYRDPSEKEAIGWNSDSYWINEGRFPNRILASGDYIVQVTIKHNDGSDQSQFLLHNPGSINGFGLALFIDQDKSSKNVFNGNRTSNR